MPKTKENFANADRAETAFYDAVARGDLEGLMALWADDDEIICVHPGAPRLVGHAAIRASWEAIFARGGVRIRVRDQRRDQAREQHDAHGAFVVAIGPRRKAAR